jgi:hypothetical protein
VPPITVIVTPSFEFFSISDVLINTTGFLSSISLEVIDGQARQNKQ